MKLIVKQDKFAKALSSVNRIATYRKDFPIVSNIFIKAQGNRLILTATNIELSIKIEIPAKIETEGEVLVPPKLLNSFVTSLPKCDLTIEFKNGRLKVYSDKYRSIFNSVPADDYPAIPEIEEKEAVKYVIPALEFKKDVSQVISAASGDTARPALTGVYLNTYEGYIYLAATDGYRLADKRVLKVDKEIEALIPATTLQEVVREIDESTGDIEIVFSAKQVLFRVNNSDITSQLIDAKYPKYKEIIPKESDTVIKINKDEFISAVKIAAIFASGSNGGINISAEKESSSLIVSSIASEYGENTSEISADVSNDGQVTLNSTYLLNALNAIDGKKIIFRFSGKLSPCVLYADEKDVDYIHVVMPLKN